jgi:YidC/Oxa1 family membrane protein insertase
MDRRTLIALVLTAIVIVATPMLFPSPKRAPQRPADTTGIARADTTATKTPSAATGNRVAPPSAAVRGSVTQPTRGTPALPPVRAESTVISTGKATYTIASPGAEPVNVVLPEYASLRQDTTRKGRVALVEPGDRLLRFRFVSEGDTIALDTVAFHAQPAQRAGASTSQTFTSTSSAVPVSITYTFPADSFVAHVTGTVGTAPAPARTWRLFITFPSRIRSEEANATDDVRHLAIGYKRRTDDVTSISFRQLDTLSTRVDTGAIRWVAERNKYFVVALVPSGRGADSTFQSLMLRGGTRTGKEATDVHATAVLAAPNGRFQFSVFAGPQAWDHLRRTAPDLENVNPYGGWLHAAVQPFATIVMRMLLWMRHTLNVSYGWVLILFGVVIRLLLWPLNQKAMRSSMAMQRLQPELAELQKKYKNDPEKQRDAMLKLYQAHGMSPFSPVLGCLPMLLPMPILFALYFAFSNTIELRGVPFMWLPDLSLKDPYYITPLFMGISMFVLSWIGMRGMPPSPQGKTMSYMMPVMMTAIFWNFASGLNLYYAVQNIAALPQQWILARERVAQKPGGGSTGSGGGDSGAPAPRTR